MAQKPRPLSPHSSFEHFIGSELRRWRQQRNLSQQQLGAKVHASADLIRRVERGERRLLPPLAELCDTALDTGGIFTDLVLSRPAARAFQAVGTSLDTIHSISGLLTDELAEDADDLLERAAARMGTYPEHAPPALWLSTQQDLLRAGQLLKGGMSFRTHRRLLQGVAILAGTAGHLLMDLGDHATAGRYLTLSHQAGCQVEDAELVAWSLAMKAIGMSTRDEWLQAANALDQATALLAQTRNDRRLAWILGLRAKVYAASGDQRESPAYLDKARKALDRAPAPTQLDFFDHPRLDGVEGAAQLLLGRTRLAQVTIQAALNRRQPDDLKGKALLMLDLAECHIIDADPAAASEQILTAARLAQSQLVAPIHNRIHSLRHMMHRWSKTSDVRVLDSQLLILTTRAKELQNALAGAQHPSGL